MTEAERTSFISFWSVNLSQVSVSSQKLTAKYINAFHSEVIINYSIYEN
jgi:hypothetical protein